MEANSSANPLVIEAVNALYMPGLLSYEKQTKQNSEWCKFGRTSVKAPITADTALLELLQRQNFLLFLLNVSLLYMLHKGREIIATLWLSDLIISACHFHLVANHKCYFVYNTGGHFQLGGKRYSRICRPSFHLVMSQVVSNTLFGESQKSLTSVGDLPVILHCLVLTLGPLLSQISTVLVATKYNKLLYYFVVP